jgi:uncharacterized protein YyaL (SSP411 family)
MTNRLIHETSPYLLQHAHNPVDWFPWGEEALQKARDEKKPILVSIGYSACHWCHVMERESFESPQIAAVMNASFVCIKVDREERPDVDAVYMDAVQAMGVRGGWPLNVFLLEDARPFYGLTYLPPTNWAQLLESIRAAYQTHYDELRKSADGFTENLNTSEILKYGLQPEKETLSVDELDLVFERLKKHFDEEKGGMDRAPKFPMPAIYKFLLRYFDLTQNQEALQHIERSLHRMALGGIYDHVGGGWARYSVDDEWFIPHFEKMLYDNGQLLSLYSEAYSLTKQPLYRQRILQTVDWIKREMLSPEGGFYSALDADSEGVEGKFYVWTQEELKQALGDEFEWFTALYGLSEEGNWEHGQNHLHLKVPPAVAARSAGIEFDDLEGKYAAALDKLFVARERRIHPGLDDKILASWNGLMLRGLVDAYRATSDEHILDLAIRNATFIHDTLLANGQLMRSFKGEARIPAFLEDYAAVIDAYTALYQVTFNEKWIAKADELATYCVANFLNPEEGFFLYSDRSAEALIATKTELFDNVIPASNSMMAHALYTLGTLLDNRTYLDLATGMAQKMTRLITNDAQWVANWAALHCLMAAPTAEVVILGPDADAFRKDLDRFFIPNKITIGAQTSSNIPLAEGKTPIDGKTTVYVCFQKTCQLPVFSVKEAIQQIQTA